MSSSLGSPARCLLYMCCLMFGSLQVLNQILCLPSRQEAVADQAGICFISAEVVLILAHHHEGESSGGHGKGRYMGVQSLTGDSSAAPPCTGGVDWISISSEVSSSASSALPWPPVLARRSPCTAGLSVAAEAQHKEGGTAWDVGHNPWQRAGWQIKCALDEAGQRQDLLGSCHRVCLQGCDRCW